MSCYQFVLLSGLFRVNHKESGQYVDAQMFINSSLPSDLLI